MSKSTEGWVQGVGRVSVPEVQYTDLPEGCYPRALHGNKYTMAVFNKDNQCIGWMDRSYMIGRAD